MNDLLSFLTRFSKYAELTFWAKNRDENVGASIPDWSISEANALRRSSASSHLD